MPELPDLTVYQESLAARVANRRLLRIRVLNPFLLRTAVPPIGDNLLRAANEERLEERLRVRSV
ncbi:MAG TPA: hypothetical protein VM489_09180, partial [Burkholderiales bacterium]|nr:hypothetical protein [Burkholderiales bacterium]